MSRPPAILLADGKALDFLNSVATPVDRPVDWIADGEGLLDWLDQAGLAPPEALEQARRAAPGALDRTAAQARELREWFRAFVQAHRGQPLSGVGAEDLAPLNALMAKDDRIDQVSPRPDGSGFELRSVRRWDGPDALLLPIGEAMARFVCEEDFTHVKACEGAACTLMFADHTQRKARRWCSMALCGNRAKQAAYRNRAKAG